jgi:hypothetical protein
VVNVPPLPNRFPPVAASYQSIVVGVLLLDAEMVTVPGPHREPLVPVALFGSAFIVATTAVLVAEIQPVVELRACA